MDEARLLSAMQKGLNNHGIFPHGTEMKAIAKDVAAMLEHAPAQVPAEAVAPAKRKRASKKK